MASAKGNFKAAVKKAKGLYKTGRYAKFSDAVKAAYKKLPGKKRKKVAAVKSIARVKRTPRVKRARKSVGNYVGNFVGSIASHKAAIKGKIKTKLGKELLSREMATTKTGRRKITRQIVKTKRELKKYC